MPDKIPTVASGRYGEHGFSPDSPAESQRLAALAEACDPATTSVLASLPIAPGGSCLEIGAGLGSIALWIADNLAPRQVVATGLDTQALSRLHHPALRVVRHDARADPFPAGSFDLIVARNVLCHLPDRQDVLARAIGWLATGGWILIEDPAFFPANPRPTPPCARSPTPPPSPWHTPSEPMSSTGPAPTPGRWHATR
jgi:SAM-dependent methyltransferase